MRKINDILKKYSLRPHRYRKEGKAFIVDTPNGNYVIKEKTNDNSAIYGYLNSRSFNYYPKTISSEEDDYEIFEYIDEYDIPYEQKIIDLVDVLSLLHNKTTHYKEINEDEYKEIFEDISNNIIYLESYYSDLINIIDNKIYMSPSEYLLARNISKVFAALYFARHELDKWYDFVKKTQKKRMVVLHNNLDISHFLRNDNSYLISWDKSKIDMPIFDLYKLYKRNGLQTPFSEVLKRYEQNYLLLPEERKLLFILMALPDKIEFTDSEYENCKIVNRMIEFVYKTDTIISPYYSENNEA